MRRNGWYKNFFCIGYIVIDDTSITCALSPLPISRASQRKFLLQCAALGSDDKVEDALTLSVASLDILSILSDSSISDFSEVLLSCIAIFRSAAQAVQSIINERRKLLESDLINDSSTSSELSNVGLSLSSPALSDSERSAFRERAQAAQERARVEMEKKVKRFEEFLLSASEEEEIHDQNEPDVCVFCHCSGDTSDLGMSLIHI